MNQNARGPYKVDGWFQALPLGMAILLASTGAAWLPELLGYEVTNLSKIVSGIVCGAVGGVGTSIAMNIVASLFRRSDQ